MRKGPAPFVLVSALASVSSSRQMKPFDDEALTELERRVAAADGYLSLALHRPLQWRDEIIRTDANEIGVAIETLRRDVPELIQRYRALRSPGRGPSIAQRLRRMRID